MSNSTTSRSCGAVRFCRLLPALLNVYRSALTCTRPSKVEVANSIVRLRTEPRAPIGVLEEIAHPVFGEQERVLHDLARRGVHFGDGVHFHRRKPDVPGVLIDHEGVRSRPTAWKREFLKCFGLRIEASDFAGLIFAEPHDTLRIDFQTARP